jgi:hypothetical protein
MALVHVTATRLPLMDAGEHSNIHKGYADYEKEMNPSLETRRGPTNLVTRMLRNVKFFVAVDGLLWTW